MHGIGKCIPSSWHGFVRTVSGKDRKGMMNKYPSIPRYPSDASLHFWYLLVGTAFFCRRYMFLQHPQR